MWVSVDLTKHVGAPAESAADETARELTAITAFFAAQAAQIEIWEPDVASERHHG
jgi:hypothetical protein